MTVVCSQPECQTTAGCVCANRSYKYERQQATIATLSARIATLEAALRDAKEYVPDPAEAWIERDRSRISELLQRIEAALAPTPTPGTDHE